MNYQIKRVGPDPIDIMCDDCPIHEIEWMEDTTLEELRDVYEEELAMYISMPDWMVEEMKQNGEWNPPHSNFDEWLKQNIAGEYIKIVE